MYQVGPGFSRKKRPFQGVILGHAHTCPRSISSTLFAFELATSVMFNSLNMLSKLLETKTTNSFNRLLDCKLAKRRENAHNRRRTQIIQTGESGEVLQSNFLVASHCTAWDAVYCYTCSVVCVFVCLLHGHKRQSRKKKTVNRSKCMSFGCGFVYPRNRHGIRWGRDLSCTRKGSFVETVILGHTQTCLRSIVSTLFTTRQQRCGLCYDFHNNLLILLFQWYCLQSCFSGSTQNRRSQQANSNVQCIGVSINYMQAYACRRGMWPRPFIEQVQDWLTRRGCNRPAIAVSLGGLSYQFFKLLANCQLLNCRPVPCPLPPRCPLCKDPSQNRPCLCLLVQAVGTHVIGRL